MANATVSVARSSPPLRVGGDVELTLEPLYSDEEGEHLVWKWRAL